MEFRWIPKKSKQCLSGRCPPTHKGFVNFYRKFVPYYAHKVKPLTVIEKKESNYSWLLPDANPSFNTLTKPSDLSSRPKLLILGAFSCRRDWELGTAFYLVCFFLRALTAPEQNYNILNKEPLTVKSAFNQRRHFLEGMHWSIEVNTDHKKLELLQQSKLQTPINKGHL